MDANILCTLLAQRIPPEQFQLEGSGVIFTDPDRNNKPVGSPSESPYDTPENRAIVADVIENYSTLEAGYLEGQDKAKVIAEVKAKLAEIDLKSIRSIRAGETDQIAEYEQQAQTERAKLAA